MRHLAKMRATRAFGAAALGLLTIVPGLAGAAAQGQTVPSPAFHAVWERTDFPVQTGRAVRSWVWGPHPNATLTEANADSPGGQRQVQYYDKSRMEVNDPRLSPSSQWYVTNGLLVVEMITGRMQTGTTSYEQRSPANVPVAGDTADMSPGVIAPSYATLASVASVNADQHRTTDKTGQAVVASLNTDGSTGTISPSTPSLPKNAAFIPEAGHNIPDVFWRFMNATGTVYENGRYTPGKVFDWLYTLGYPISEPYWINIRINSKPVQVMMQAFQRRILTYNPQNEAAWRVEMGNVGMQYYAWRYGTGGNVGPTPTPQPVGGQALRIRKLDQPAIFALGQYSSIHDPLYAVITTQDAYTALWAKHIGSFEMVEAPPPVYFRSEIAIAAFWGDKPNGCYKTTIKSATLSGNTVTVSVEEVMRPGTCTQVITQPNDFAAVAKGGLQPGKYSVVFVDQAGTKLQANDLTLP